MITVGIDIGTSGVKVALLGDHDHVIAHSSQSLRVSRPQPGFSEQAPEDWWQAACAGLDDLKARHGTELSEVTAIGLSGQMHGATLLDAAGEVLRPCILWNDGRSEAECAALERDWPALREVTGNIAMPGFTAPKLLWVREHEPELFARVAHVLLPKDWLRLQLTGDKVSDPSDAAGTLWLDVARRDWSDELLHAGGLTRAQMPRLVESNSPSGVLKPELARAWGLGAEVIVAGGAGDNAASAIGIGATQPGDGFISLGTSGVLFVVNDRFAPNPASAVHAFCHALPERWHQMSVMLSAASCLRWFCQLVGRDEATLLAELARDDSAVNRTATAPLFLPYLAGERTPHNDPFAPGVFHGLTMQTTRADCTYAVLEGVTFGLADGLDALRAAGTQVHQLSLVGGGSRSHAWAQLIADALRVDIALHTGSEAGGALGAARLGRLATGAPIDRVCTRPPVAALFSPDPERHARLAPRLARFRDLYRRLRGA